MKKKVWKNLTGRSIALFMALAIAGSSVSYAETTAENAVIEAEEPKEDDPVLEEGDLAREEELNEDDLVPEEEQNEDDPAPEEELNQDDSVPEEEMNEDDPVREEESNKDDPSPEVEPKEDNSAEEESPEEETSGSNAGMVDETEADDGFETEAPEGSSADPESGISDTEEDDESEKLQEDETSEAALQDEPVDYGELLIEDEEADTETWSELLIKREADLSLPEDGSVDIGEPAVLEEGPESETELARLQASPSKIIIYGIDGKQYKPSDFNTDYVALFYGRIGSSSTQTMMELLENQLDPSGPSVKLVLMDVNSTSAELKAYAKQYPKRFVSHYEGYILQYYDVMGTSGSVKLPGLVIIKNSTGNVAFSSQGLAQDELYRFLENAGIVKPVEMCTFRIGGTADYPAAFEALRILNEKRTAAGLKPLVMDESLLATAMQRAAEIYYYYYSDHTRPDGSSCFTAFPKATSLAENIAKGRSATPESVTDAWANSPGHNANMMNPNVTDIGIGCFYIGDSLTGSSVRWAQSFAYGNSRKTAKERNAAYKEFSIKAVSDTVNVGVDKNTIELYVGETFTPELMYMDGGNGAGPLIVTFTKTGNSSVASVSSDGTIKANGAGSTTVKIGVDADHCADVKVAVRKRAVPVQSVSLDINKAEILIGDTLQLQATVAPANASYKVVTWSVNDSRIVSVDESGRVKALKAGKATVTVTTMDGDYKASCELRVLFTDVPSTGVYYSSPVYWAADKGITSGYSDGSFGVGRDCQRRELMIFLWRYAGQPTGYGDARTMFNDLSAYGTSTATNKAIAWAYKTGISKGYSDGGFHPEEPIVRKDVMIMLYRLAGKPAVSGTLSFPDCEKYSTTGDTYKAILWGSQNGITNGYSEGEYAGQFGDMLNCLREQIVTFLKRYDNKKGSWKK